jgi:hypothetical protein
LVDVGHEVTEAEQQKGLDFKFPVACFLLLIKSRRCFAIVFPRHADFSRKRPHLLPDLHDLPGFLRSCDFSLQLLGNPHCPFHELGIALDLLALSIVDIIQISRNSLVSHL